MYKRCMYRSCCYSGDSGEDWIRFSVSSDVVAESGEGASDHAKNAHKSDADKPGHDYKTQTRTRAYSDEDIVMDMEDDNNNNGHVTPEQSMSMIDDSNTEYIDSLSMHPKQRYTVRNNEIPHIHILRTL